MPLRTFSLTALVATSFLSAKHPVPGLTTTPSGLEYVDMRPGAGKPPEVGQTCTVLYRGWIYVAQGNHQGKLFDSAQDPKHPFHFHIGKGEVIPGWDEGIKAMKPGGKRVLIIPPALAYASQGYGDDIPPGATLLFEVELLSVKK